MVFFWQLGCVEDFRRTTRMGPGVHHELLELLRPHITRQRTNFREPISAEERLSLTLRYLANGKKYLLSLTMSITYKKLHPHSGNFCPQLSMRPFSVKY